MNLQKRNQTSILDSRRERDVLHLFAFCSLADGQTDKIFVEKMLIHERNVHKKLDLYLN